PEVFSASWTILPEKISSVSEKGRATGRLDQFARSSETAWPQDMLPQVLPCGLFWKNACHMPLCRMRPLGSFIQVSSAVRWNLGRCTSVSAAGGDVKFMISLDVRVGRDRRL